MSVTYFPKINSAGVVTQRPYKATASFSTEVKELESGIRHTHGWRGTGLSGFPTRALFRGDVAYQAITDAEVAVLRAFFDSMKGRYGEFIFLDPNGNLVDYPEDFSVSAWNKSGASIAAGQPDPYKGTRGSFITGAASLDTAVLPDGFASGVVLCSSIWAWGPGTATIGFSGLGTKTWQLSNSAWTRISHVVTVSGSSAVRMSLSFSGSTNVFGAQCVPGPAEGGYLRKPGRFNKCHFATDQFLPKYLGPNQISLTLPIEEYN